MKVQDIGPAIAKRVWIVIALVLLSTLVAAIVAQVQSPVYKVETAMSATAPVNPTTKLPDATVQAAYIALVPSIGNFAESLGVAEAVSARLANQGIELSPEELLKKVSAVPEANSTSIKITFSDGSPTRVADIANTWGEVLVLKSNQTSEYFDPEFKNLLLNGNMVFTNRAAVPEKPTQPKTFAYIGLGFFTGLLLGLVLVVFIEYFNPHFRNPREVEETLDLPMLGTLPREKGARSTALLSSFDESSRTWEAYSELRSSLIMPPEGSPASILVASAIPFEAGAAIAANIAASIANTGRRVLLVDCDLKGRSLSKLMDAYERSGLSDALERRGDIAGEVIASGVADLFFLPAGTRRDNSTDLLSLPSFQEKLREQEGDYDKVLLYAPPLLGSVDAAVVAAQAEASLVLIDADRCTRTAAQEAMFSFQRLGIVPTGVALVNVKIKGGKRSARAHEAKPARVKAPAAEQAVPAAPAASITTAEESGTLERKAKSRKERKAVETGASGAGTVSAEPPTQAGEAEAAAAAAAETAAAEKTRVEAREETSSPQPPTAAFSGASPRSPEPSRGSAPSSAGAAEGLQQIKESVAEDFRRMGETGAPIPKNWLRALKSDKADVRESATAAITIYYQQFLRRYRISDESVESITASIIRMMRREGEFAAMSEDDAQLHLRQMLMGAGARFSTSTPYSVAPTAQPGDTGVEAARGGADSREVRRQEKRRFRLDTRGARKPGGKGGDSAPQKGDEEGIDWE